MDNEIILKSNDRFVPDSGSDMNVVVLPLQADPEVYEGSGDISVSGVLYGPDNEAVGDPVDYSMSIPIVPPFSKTVVRRIKDNKAKSICCLVILLLIAASLPIIATTTDVFGHDLVHHDAQEPTCTEVGWYEYDTCSRCGYTTYKEIPATGIGYVSYYSDGKLLSVTECNYGTAIESLPTPPAKEDYTFSGWCSDPDCKVPYVMDSKVTGDLSLYAGWVAIVYYNVTFDFNDGSEQYRTQVAEGGKVTVPAEVSEHLRTGYGLVSDSVSGWYTDYSYDTEWVFDTDTVTKPIVLVAKWIEPYAEISLYMDGSKYGSVSSQIGKTIVTGLIDDPVKPLHTFVGWYADPDFETVWNIGSDVVSGDMKLYAKFVSDVEYDPSIQGDQFYVGEVTIGGRTYYLEYGGTMKDVVLVNLYNGSLKVTPGGSFEWTKQDITGKEITDNVQSQYNQDMASSWNASVSSTVISGIESDPALKAKIEGILSSSAGYGGSLTTGMPYTYTLSYSATISSKETFDLGNYDVGNFVTYAILGDVDVFAAYYVNDKGVVQKEIIYNTYGLYNCLIQSDIADGFRTSFDKEIDHVMDGTGNTDDPYQVSNALDLCMVRSYTETGSSFLVTEDISLEGVVWIPIFGDVGTFDGNGHKVENLTFKGTPYLESDIMGYAGLFGTLSGTVKNLEVSGEIVITWPSTDDSNGKQMNLGMIAGALFVGTIQNCKASGKVHANPNGYNAYANVGGIVGVMHLDESKVLDCESHVWVVASASVSNIAGGIAGMVYGGVIDGCSNYGAVYTTCMFKNHFMGPSCCAGGLVGQSINFHVLTNCHSYGTVEADWCSEPKHKMFIGGYIGWAMGTIDFTGTEWESEVANINYGGSMYSGGKTVGNR